MFIITERGSAVPVSSIDVVLAKGTGSVIRLKSGTRVQDARTPSEVLLSAATPDIKELLGHFVKDVEMFKSAVLAELGSLKTQTLAELEAITLGTVGSLNTHKAETLDATTKLIAEVGATSEKLSNVGDSLGKQSRTLGSGVNTTKTMTNTLNKLVGDLYAALQEV